MLFIDTLQALPVVGGPLDPGTHPIQRHREPPIHNIELHDQGDPHARQFAFVLRHDRLLQVEKVILLQLFYQLLALLGQRKLD